jgi:hypothetical protein
MTSKSRGLLWALSVVVAFILGYLLARHMCADRMTSSGAGGGASTNAVSQDSASAAARASAAAANGSGAAGGNGGPTSPSGTGGKAPGSELAVSGAGGAASGGGGDDRGAPKASDNGGGGATSSGGLRMPGGSPGSVDSSSVSAMGTRAAADFTFDVTGLPRYPSSVTKVASTLTLDPAQPGDSASRCVIVTSDSFETVKQWYQTHLPAGWHEQSAADVEQLAKQVSPENIMKMLGAAQQGGTTPALPPITSSSSSGAARLSLAIWSAPVNATHSERQVMVKGAAGQPTQIDMGRTVRP